ncbi:hypothetical protein [Bacillus sp. T33-2]|uniref:hypothetical protein n=1 Tax=Bacillus sp. T33-2 TaxID=2054168 RepID=UPI000C759071|nr:hypothetical protein [Bacillus sp. T33-2]PLR97308.1 hypothetical protein CVD19_07410 [Bacillus sp. T33-2]
MDDNKRFFRLLKPVRRQLLIGSIIKEAQLLFCYAAVWSVLLMLAARFMVIPFFSRYIFTGLVILVVVHIVRVWQGRPGWRDAALVYNEFVPDDRVITGLTFLEHAGVLAKMQLQDAIQHMVKQQQPVMKRKKQLIIPHLLTAGALLGAVAIALYFIPSDKIELAKQREEEIKLVKNVEKQLDKKAKEQKDPAVKKALKEAEEKISKAESAEEALKELAKQKKQLELKTLKEREKQEALTKWESSLKAAGLSELASFLAQKDLKKIEKELAELNKKWNSLPKEQKAALSDFTKHEKQMSEEELAAMMKAIEEGLLSPEMLKKLADAQAALQSTGLSMQQQMADNGTPPSQLAFSSSNSSSNNQGPSNMQSSTGNGNQSSQGSNPSSGGNKPGGQNGSGSGSGNGNGNGSGGSGSGAGSGSGLGSGAGLGQGSRELLTIPEYTDGKKNIETDTGKLGNGSAAEQSEGNGPVLKGTIRPYSEVFGEYEQSYRQSTERYKLPAELEEMVKNYFTNIDPDRE